uniref:Thymidylate kinase n=1 Tax=Chlorobium chlorochromatii (strain CaD3) TaxID=340177 RepID=KTHY_CHLCH|nr:RecName: Full=Thymidylate kinase; AltName: Full=dTMP kinase [Chlorobium chlorochromatii CaD3]
MLITFEGIDGAGKSTQVAKLVAYLKQQSTPLLSLREPGGTPTAESIRSLLLDNRKSITPIAELLLFSASRAELVETLIRPALAEGKTVILDRFFDSTTAYQGHGRGISLEQLHSIIALSTGDLLPDVTFYLDLEPEEALRRAFSRSGLPLDFAAQSNESDRMEQAGIAFYHKVRNGYLTLMQQHPSRFVALDATQPPDTLHQHIIAEVETRLKLHISPLVAP